MVILRGNPAGPGSYPDERGNTKVAWPLGALHVQAASSYARMRNRDPVVLDVPGLPQSENSPQAKAALKAFLEDEAVDAFYGFSGGGYNLLHVLTFLARDQPDTIHRIHLVIVIGSPTRMKGDEFDVSHFNATARGRSKQATEANWDVVYRTNPIPSQMPKGLPKGIGTHMFGPDILVAGWPEGVGNP
jgi:hypothetical protein